MLFKEELNTKAGEIKQYIAVNASVAFKSILPYITTSERDYIKPLLGNDQYTELCSYYQSTSSWDPEEGQAEAEDLANLLPLVQQALINLAYWKGYPALSVNIGDGGAFRIEKEHEKSLFQYQEENLRNSFKNEGFNTLDKILEFLEENIDKFPCFSASATYTVFKKKFIRTAGEFDAIYGIGGSRLVFLKLQPFIDQVNDLEIIPIIGPEYWEEIRIVMSSGADLLALQQRFIDFVKKIQAFLSVARGISELGVNITDKGFFFETSASNSDNFRKKDIITDNTLDALRRNAEQNGRAYIQYLQDFLHDNIGDFPVYAEYSGYNEGESSNPFIRDNNNKTTFWA